MDGRHLLGHDEREILLGAQALQAHGPHEARDACHRLHVEVERCPDAVAAGAGVGIRIVDESDKLSKPQVDMPDPLAGLEPLVCRPPAVCRSRRPAVGPVDASLA
jgi:hypothetical protein